LPPSGKSRCSEFVSDIESSPPLFVPLKLSVVCGKDDVKPFDSSNLHESTVSLLAPLSMHCLPAASLVWDMIVTNDMFVSISNMNTAIAFQVNPKSFCSIL
jgi:hypothetical protein